jgi:hypothetical protein
METKPVTVAVVDDQEESWGMTAKVGGGFIIGLLLGIGGTWLVMNSNTGDSSTTGAGATTTEGVITGTGSTSTGSVASGGTGSTNSGSNTGGSVSGGGSDAAFMVSNQSAGGTVKVDKVTFGKNGGWVVIRDDVNGAAGPRILGASWFPEGASMNGMVSLLRNTEAGKKYHALLHADTNGDKQYKTADDQAVADQGGKQVESVFSAQ